MSFHSIHLYHNEVENLKTFGGTTKETAIRNAFYNLLNDYARQRGLIVVAEVSVKTSGNKIVTPDGTLKDSLRQDWGYWESKDEADKLDDEIEKKFAKGYPKDNILFEDSRIAVLIQNGDEVLRCNMNDENALHLLLTEFFSFERPEVRNFRQAIELFRQDVPKVTETIRQIILNSATSNTLFVKELMSFLELCRGSINPAITRADVYEMIIQHILTEDIFNTIFDETQFHRENNIARELEKVIATFFAGSLRKETLRGVKHYYDAINAAAAGIADHHEKQKFLKVVYETFYRSYNPKAADRLGVVYTPNEIVRFMIESADYLLHKHFDKYLEDPDVEILDPATGTGTFICDLIDYIRREKLEYKYKNEIHANEVAILPYYISNLNIEFTYAQKMNRYVEFENLCFVDTLDNTGFHYAGKQLDVFSEENTQRIKEQNKRKISVIIGNPPYNANQQNENDNNKNREYPEIDKRIRDTFIKYSTAQKTKLYDMYARFYRWTFDRLENQGIVAFVTNRSFIDSRTFDGFRKTVQQDFDAAYIIDTKSDIRANPKIAGTTHNVFGIQTGVAIMFLIKKQKRDNKTCKIHYIALDDFWRKEQKLQWLAEHPLKNIPFEIIRPDKNNNWINLTDNDFDSLLPLCSKNAKLGRGNETLFELFSTGIVTARDAWVFDLSKENLSVKIKYFIDTYREQLKSGETDNELLDYTIKWSDTLKSHLKRKANLRFDGKIIVTCLYRPYHQMLYYSEKKLSDRLTSNHTTIFGNSFNRENMLISYSGIGSSKSFSVLASNKIFSLDFLEKTQCLPLYRYDKDGVRIDNITDWGLQQFVNHYGDDSISKENVFHYVYAVLHNPTYRKKYETNLKRDFPRIPLYDDFRQWTAWGKQLIHLHIDYENVKRYPLQVIEDADKKTNPKPKLKADKSAGVILLDEQTELHNIPVEAWNYKLGNRSALEWILDQYQEKKPKDPTIAEKFNAYRFADYRQQVIDLLMCVCTVSVETMRIVGEMENAQNS
ncbi:MAG: N-6 DNA methylase [Prevotellaceae bacterium]|jgi:predicted helicase|nr:N-6 DNA methylase [Prevotellaceae bacterium]